MVEARQYRAPSRPSDWRWPEVTDDTDFGIAARVVARSAQTLRSFRQDRGLSCSDLSIRLGLGRNTVWQYERRGYGDFQTVLRILEWMHREEIRERDRIRLNRGPLVDGDPEPAGSGRPRRRAIVH